MAEPFDAFAAALLDAADRGAPARPSLPQVLEVYGTERYPASALARDLLGIEARLPRRGTARRHDYERARRGVTSAMSGRRPARSLVARIRRSAATGRLRGVLTARRARALATYLRTRGGAISIEGEVRIFGYMEQRRMPARGLQPMAPERWARILDAFAAADPDEFLVAISGEFSAAYMGTSSSFSDTQRGTLAVELVDVAIRVEPIGAP